MADIDVEPGSGETPDDLESSLRLLERARAGDPEALDRLCARHLPALRRWASGRLPRWARGVDDTDDIVQETLLQTLRNVEGFEPRREGALAAYLHCALVNKIKDHVRRSRRQPISMEIDSREIDPGPSPLEETLGLEALDSYETALARLDDEEREAIILRIEMGYAYADLARALGKRSPDAARMAVTRALLRLAHEMNHGSP